MIDYCGSISIQSLLDAVPSGAAIRLPAGRHVITTTLVVPANVSLIGAGVDLSVLHYTGSGVAVQMGEPTAVGQPVQIGRLADLSIVGNGLGQVGSVGLQITKGSFGQIERVMVVGLETGFRIDGADLWCASNLLVHPRTSNVKYGLLLTADIGKQVNHTVVLGGYLYGDSARLIGGYGFKIERGDTNLVLCTAVEDFDCGFWVTSPDAGGNRLYSPRTEGIIAQSILLDTGTQNTIVLSSGGAVVDRGINNFVLLSNGFPTGTALDPSVSFYGDQDSGLYSAGPNIVGVAAGGVPRMQVGAGIGIGLWNAPNPNTEVFVVPSVASWIGLLIKAAVGQSADLSAWKDSSWNILSRINRAGYFMTKKTTAPADGDLENCELAIWFDSTGGAAKLMIKAKEASGIVRTGSVRLV